MKKTIVTFAIGLLSSQLLRSQGTVYLSNLGQTPTGSNSVGSDSWIASEFTTGANSEGYLLDLVQLKMADALGSPGGFTAMVYSATGVTGIVPGTSLETLTDSLNPVTAGIYTYTPASSITLTPSTHYFIVLTAGTMLSTGAYEWSVTSPIFYNSMGGWGGAGGVWKSSNGSTWQFNGGAPQFAITATPIPEPSILSLIGLSGLLFIRYCWKQR